MSTEHTETAVAKTDESPAKESYTYSPRVDIHEDEHAFYVEAELPGVADDGVDVKLEDGVLTLLGRVTPPSPEGYQQVYSEYRSGNYERTFRITDAVDADKIEATLRHGLLTLTLPKREAIKPRTIQVRVA